MTGTMDDLTTDGFHKWLDDMTSIDTTGYGTDSTPIPQNNPIADYIATHSLDQNALLLQQWILGKESGLETRSAMGYEAVYLCSRVLESINLYNDVYNRQSDVEQRMTKTEGDFQSVIKNATVDSEVILARDSDTYGSFATLDKRLENDELILAQFAPVGFRVTINHGLGINPAVSVYYYEDAIGTEANGLATASHGLGEINTQSVSCLPTYPDANTLVVDMPMNFKLNGTPQPARDGNFYLIDGNKTLKFDIGGLLKPKPNLISGTTWQQQSGVIPANDWQWSWHLLDLKAGETVTYSVAIDSCDFDVVAAIDAGGVCHTGNVIMGGSSGIATISFTADKDYDGCHFRIGGISSHTAINNVKYREEKAENSAVRTAWVQ